MWLKLWAQFVLVLMRKTTGEWRGEYITESKQVPTDTITTSKKFVGITSRGLEDTLICDTACSDKVMG